MKAPNTFLKSILILGTAAIGACLISARADEPAATIRRDAPDKLPRTVDLRAVVEITLDHPDWTYELGQTATFHIVARAGMASADGLQINYRLGPEMREGQEHAIVLPAHGLTLTASSPTQPGFIRCIVSGEWKGAKFRALATAGFAPFDLKPTQTEAADFDKFWDEQKALLARIPPEYRSVPAPELSTNHVETSYISFQNVGGWAGPSRFYGVLCVPRGPGPFPAVLNVPGAGVRPYSGLRSLAEKGVITLQVGVHGIPVDLPKELYDELYLGALSGYNRFNLDDRYAYYYHRIYLGCIRANDCLVSQPTWDHKNLLVMGGSQGGQLSIVTRRPGPACHRAGGELPPPIAM